MRKKLLSILLILCMILTLLPTVAMADGFTTRETGLDLTSNNIAYSNGSGSSTADPTAANITDTVEGWTWYANETTVGSDTYAAKTLVLNGLTLDTEAASALIVPDGTAIILAEDTTSTIRSGDASSGSSYGICGKGDLTIKGAGTLDVTAGQGQSSTGIYSSGMLTMNGGCIFGVAGRSVAGMGILSDSTLTINGGRVSGNAGESFGGAGIYSVGNLIMNGGSISGIGSGGIVADDNERVCMASEGIYSDKDLIINGGTVNAESKPANLISAALYADEITITEGIITAENGTTESDHSTAAAICAKTALTVGSDALPAIVSNATDGTTAITASSGEIESNQLIMSGGAVTISFSIPTAADYATTDPAAASGTDYILDQDNKSLTIKTAKGAAYWSASGSDFHDYNIKLDANIDVSDFIWKPVCNDIDDFNEADKLFTGTFDGQEHCISGMNAIVTSTNDEVYAGLFGAVLTGTVKNVTVSGTVNAVSTDEVYAGGITGIVMGTSDHQLSYLENCVSNVSVNAESTDADSSDMMAYAGGLTGGHLYTHTINCVNTGSVSASSESEEGTALAGGLAGAVASEFGSCVNNSYNTGTVSAAVTQNDGQAFAGGITGILQDEYLRNCYNTGSVSATCAGDENGGIAGGIAGYVSKGTIISCFYLENSADIGVKYEEDSPDVTAVSKTAVAMKSSDFVDDLNRWVDDVSGTEDFQNAKYWGIFPGTNSGYPAFSGANYTGITSSHGGGSSNQDSGAPVIVDGKSMNIGKETRAGESTTVTVDQSKLSDNLKRAMAGSSVVVPIGENSAATAALVVQNIEDMAAKGMTLTVQNGKVSYNIDTAAIDTESLAAAFPGMDMSKIPFEVSVKNSSANVEGETLVLSPVEFTITAAYDGKTVSVDTFSAYIDRMIEVTVEQAAKITTAVVVNADGSTRHVPTKVIEKGGKYYAVVNSRTNSTYALIQNEVKFADASGKWYESTVNEMGSRKIIGGRSASVFDGDASITRAEFAAILVRALGLPADGKSTFRDISDSAWYSGAVGAAVQCGLVDGRGENQFDPGAYITRQEAMEMLRRAAALTGFNGVRGSLDDFTDGNSVGSWAQDAAAWSIGSGLIQGANGKLNPTENITRAESATIILRLLEKAGLVDPMNLHDTSR